MAAMKQITKSDADEKLLQKAFKRCKNLLNDLMEHRHGWVFTYPVDVKGMGLTDYYKIVKHPMDLGMVKLRLDKRRYLSPVQFARDIKLTFNNAMMFNLKGEPAYDMAEELLKIFLKEWCCIKVDFASLLSDDDMVFKWCQQLLGKIMQHRYGRNFHTLVDADMPGYNQIVRRTMDLGTIRAKLETEKYSSPLEFVEDVRLTFYNAMLYHDEEEEAHITAKELLEVFNKKWALLMTEFEPLFDDD